MFWFFAGLLVAFFGLIVLRGAPYVPTHKKQVETALDLLDLQPDEILVDLGSGDGVLLKAAAKRGIIAHGYELNPILCAVSYVRCWPQRHLVHIHFADFWFQTFPSGTKGVFTFMAKPFMKKIQKKLEQEAKTHGELRFVSYGFELPKISPIKTENGLHLYKIKP